MPTRERITKSTKFVYMMWVIVLLDPQWWIARYAGSTVRQIPTVLFAIMLMMVIVKPPKTWFPPLMTFMLYTMAIVPFSYNRGQTFDVVKFLIVFYVLALGTVAFVKNAKHAVFIVTLWGLGQFMWWVVLGVARGRVRWHPTLANYDSFGPMMAMGIGATYFYALSTSNKRERTLAFLTCLGCIGGLVSSFARGAFLAGIAVLGWMWLRSNRKGVTTVAVVAGAAAVGIMGLVFEGVKRADSGTNFFAEMATISNNVSRESDRSVLWRAARRVWAENPVFGVGAMNFGAYAAEHFRAGEVGGAYNANPATLYGRQLHSTYYQILCEYGTIGSAIFVWMLLDFFKHNMRLKRKPYRDRWAAVTGGRLDLKQLSFAVETAMIGYLASSLFYNQIFDVHWLYTLVIVNGLLSYVAKPLPAPVRLRGGLQRA